MTENIEPDSAEMLTERASRILNRASAAVTEEILRIARLSAEARGSREITEIDIVSGLQQLGLMSPGAAYARAESAAKENRRALRLGVLTAATAFITALAGIVVNSGLPEKKVDLSALTAAISVLASTVGALAIGLAYLISLRTLRQRKIAQEAVLAGLGDEAMPDSGGDALTFIQHWIEIERRIVESLSLTQSERTRTSLGQMIAAYAQLAGLSKQQEDQVRQLLRVRNQVVHGALPSHIDLVEANRRARTLLDTLRKTHLKKRPHE
ncbi:hypothetical protein [Micromonospora purpureochromogenes]|uniref:Apea-like HEPN domain-containing protein n=1 Tax=Micromonospora purpureochromogenes TaxID=47872 RepID=A0ABX2RMP2_9ACTN|nr:hypothetical protein [Micromonospora purpureochromogenes]NYF56564.1 hypothetical protein [Micromonospora purpureochromogenes]